VVGSWGGLRMILHRKDRKFAVAESLDRAVIEVHVCDLECRRTGDPRLVALHGEPVILRRDEHATRLELANGVISASMSIRHLLGGRAEAEAQDLMPEADPEDR